MKATNTGLRVDRNELLDDAAAIDCQLPMS